MIKSKIYKVTLTWMFSKTKMFVWKLSDILYCSKTLMEEQQKFSNFDCWLNNNVKSSYLSPLCSGWIAFLCSVLSLIQTGPLDVISDCNEKVLLRQLSYAIKNQLKEPKAPY